MESPESAFFNEPRKSSWYHHPIFVIAMLFLVLGPLGLPLLFKSPRFSRNWKIFWTLMMVAYTWAMIGGTLKIAELLLNTFKEANLI